MKVTVNQEICEPQRALERSLSNQDWLSPCSTSGYESEGPLVTHQGQGLH